MLRFFGETMENDEATLDQLKVSNGTRLDAAFRQRTPSELEALKAINYVLVVDTSGECAVMDGLSAATPVAALKERLKTPQCLLYFSTTFSPTFGTPLADERTLGSYGVLGAARTPCPLAVAKRGLTCERHIASLASDSGLPRASTDPPPFPFGAQMATCCTTRPARRQRRRRSRRRRRRSE